MFMPKLSVILCAYNVAKYLSSAFALLSNQIFRNIEIIIVDDGSTDGKTPTLCDRFSEEDYRVRVIHKENGGLGSARNAGIEAASGDYIMFYDADDFLALGATKVVNEKLCEEDVDVLMFGYVEHSERYDTDFSFSFKDLLLKNKEIRDNYVNEFSGLRFNNGFAWNKVYRRKFLIDNNLRFGTEAIQQDEPFNLRVYRTASSIRLIPDILYEYRVFDKGNNRARYIPERVEIYKSVFDEYRLLISEWNITDTEFIRYVYKKFIDDIICALTYNFSQKKCPLSFSEKNRLIKAAFYDSDVMEASEIFRTEVVRNLNFPQRMFYFAIYKRSLSLFYAAKCTRVFYTILSYIYHTILDL